MLCPRCHNEIAANAAVCPVCRSSVEPVLAELDTDSLWDDSPPPDDAYPGANYDTAPQHTGPVAAPPPPRGGRAAAPPPTGSPALTGPLQAPPEASGGSEQGAIATRIVQLDPEGDRNTRIVDISVPAMVKRAQRERATAGGTGRSGADAEEPPTLFDELMTRARHFYMRMHRFDRWTCWVLVLAFISAFLPWRRVQGIGLVSGLEGFGGPSAVAAALAFGALYWRTERRRLAGLLITGQALAVAAIAGTPVYLFVGVTGVRFAFGLYATILMAGLALLLTLARLARINV